MLLGLEQKNTQHLTLTPQMQQALKILQFSTLELLQEIAHMAEENPFLEVEPPETADDSPEPEESFTSFSDSQNEDNPFDFETPVTLPDHLLSQLGCLQLEPHDRLLVEWLIGLLNDEGMLEDSLETIAAEAPFEDMRDPEDWVFALKLLQSFDPSGVGARSISELLSLQINSLRFAHLPKETRTLALDMVTNHLELISRKNFLGLKKEYKCSDRALKEALELVSVLNPHPVSNWKGGAIRYIVPEIAVVLHDGKWVGRMVGSATPAVRINELYASALKETKTEADYQLWQNKLTEARFFLKNILQRKQTVKLVSDLIIEKQQDFFFFGESKMKPLILKDIAEELGLHESTVSRVTHGKYLISPKGLLELKFFFSSSLSCSQGELSSTAIKAHIKALIAQEDPHKPLSDSKIVEILKQKNIEIARRTVAKYRDQLGINVASLRKAP